MSRLIVKSLPKNITEEKLRSLFGSKGTVTDIQLKYTKEGAFRQFAFVGYQTDEQADAALEYFDNTFIQTSRLKVQRCAPLGSEEKPKAWSKYSKESSAFKKMHGQEEEQLKESEKEPEKKNKKKERISKLLESHKDDPKFAEFMQVHAKGRSMWGNDAPLVTEDAEENVIAKKEKESKKTKKTTTYDSPREETKEEVMDAEFDDDKKLAEKEITDIDYMKSLMKKSSENKTKSANNSKTDNLFTIKIYNLPYQVKRHDIIKFFRPVKPLSIRLPSKVHGFCYVGFKTEKEFDRAMLKDKSFLGKKQLFFSDYNQKNIIMKRVAALQKPMMNGKDWTWKKQRESLQHEEDISESGIIYFRNLSYTAKEDDLQQLFEKYGPVAEVNLPIDRTSRKIKGFGTVTFVMPEHAVRAFSELDGTLFQGRLLHLIPGKAKQANDENQDLSFKQKKELDLKKSAGLSHNWNTLFLGADAVANLLASRFETSKETILDSSGGGSSAAVRLALGETQIVMEMKKFLEDNDVRLNVFDGPAEKRSKTVILAKNLHIDTKVSDLTPLFSQFGLIGRIVLPPSGVTALIEFLDPSEARKAFRNLAYSKFKDLPLFLEWAPENTFKTEAANIVLKNMVDGGNIEKTETNKNGGNVKINKELNSKPTFEEPQAEEKELSDEDDDEDPEPETTLFLRNLNFATREDAIRAHFKHLGAIHMVQVAMRKDPDDSTKKISLGYGFIQFKKKKTTEKALKTMQFTQIEGNQVELKRSDRVLKSDVKNNSKKTANTPKQTGSKILVRNIPFQAKPNEVRDIFKAFGELESVRLPKKMIPGEEAHRGFGFVNFVSKSDAKKAFDALSQSTHLYGRRLALEWAAVDDDDVNTLRKRTAENFGYDKGRKVGRKSVFDASVVDNAENICDDS